MEETLQDAVTTTTEQETELDLNLDDMEDVEALKAQIALKDTFARQAVARAKKAEADLKALRAEGKAEATHSITNTSSEEATAVMILQSQGLDDDAIAYLKKIAAVNGTSIIAAKSDELYKAFEVKRDVDEKSKKASLGASRGSGSVKKEKSISTPNLTEEEHKELWRKSSGR